MKINFFFLIFLNFNCLFPVNSQQYLGVVGSNYAGTNSIYTNPANVVDSRYKLYINLAAADIFIGNNALKWAAPYSFTKMLSGAITNNKVRWRPSYLEPIENRRTKNLNALADTRGPSILYTIGAKQGIAITSRARGALSFTNVSPELATLMQYGPRNPTIIKEAQNLNMSVNMNAFIEIGLTYGRDISLSNEDAIKIGITAKRIIGLTNFHFIAKESDFQLVNILDADNPPGIIENALNLQKINVKYGHSDERTGFDSFSFKPGYWLGKSSPGRGFGFDLGLSYEHRPYIQKYNYKEKGKQKIDLTQNKYEYKIGFSLIDIGLVKFNNPAYVSNFSSIATNKIVLDNTMRILPTRRLIKGINNSLDVAITTDKNAFNANLPTTFQAYFDYKLKENIYIYSTWVQNIYGSNSIGMRMPSLISVIPRYESKFIDLALPMSLLNDYQLFSIGLSTRLGPFFIGSDNLQGLLNIGNPKGMNLYAGLSIPIFNTLPTISTKCYYEKSENNFIQKLKFFNKKK